MRSSMHPMGSMDSDSQHGTEVWRDLIERSPVATFVLRGGTGIDAASILYCNTSARTAFHLQAAHESPHQSILDVVDSEDHELVHGLLSIEGDSFGPIEVDVLLSLSGSDTPNDSGKGRYALHIQPTEGGRIIAQLVRSDGWRAVDDMLSEQHSFRSALMQLSQLAYTAIDDDEFYQSLLEHAVAVVPGAQGGSVQLSIGGTTDFRFVAAVGYDLEGLQEQILNRTDFFRDASDPRARIVREFDNHGRSPEIVEWLERVGRLSEIVVNVSAPVVVQGSAVAFLSLDNFEDPAAITETSVEMTTVLGQLIGDLWLRRRLEAELREEREALRQQAMQDPLTGLANRRRLDRTIHEVVDANRQSATPSAVLFVDIDNFKGVNDRLGHEVGDLLLIAVANELRSVADASSTVGRWGGDEFLIVPTKVGSCAEAQALATRVLTRFEQELELDGLKHQARLSVGIGWSEDSSLSAAQLVRAGDEALYDAKAAGKATHRLRVSS